MKLWLVRHCDAGDHSSDPRVERTRPLTDAGRKQAWAVANRLLALGAAPRVILASPYARTTETADVLGRVLGARVAHEDALQPDRPLERFLARAVLADDGLRRVMLVGHSDNLGPLLRALGHDRADAKLGKGEARHLRVDRDARLRGEVYRVAPPDPAG